ncbi:MAG: regulatory protein RecX [Flavobacteriales bacterium]
MSSIDPVITKARAYCARQERCQQEVRDKLYAWGAHQKEVEATITKLITEGFLNEARFAEHFAVSKFRQKGWGRRKIEEALKLKRVSEPCIRLGLKAVDGTEYQMQLTEAVRKRWEKAKEPDAYIKRQKAMAYFLRRGFSVEQIETALEHV